MKRLVILISEYNNNILKFILVKGIVWAASHCKDHQPHDIGKYQIQSISWSFTHTAILGRVNERTGKKTNPQLSKSMSWQDKMVLKRYWLSLEGKQKNVSVHGSRLFDKLPVQRALNNLESTAHACDSAFRCFSLKINVNTFENFRVEVSTIVI